MAPDARKVLTHFDEEAGEPWLNDHGTRALSWEPK